MSTAVTDRLTGYTISRALNVLNFGNTVYTHAILVPHTQILSRNLLRRFVLMLTISDLIAVLALCATFYSLGYMHGKHDSKTQK